MTGYELAECCLCSLRLARYETPKHLKWAHGWKDEHALAYAIPGWTKLPQAMRSE